MSVDALRERLADRYEIGGELGRGGMGAVYLSRDLRLDRPVALKVLTADLGGVRERFLREIRTAASFSHPNIVPVYSVEQSDDFLAYAMAYVEGETLTERIRRTGTLGAREMVKLLQDVAYALAYAHGRGVVHRDVKPDNIMIERATGRALVMDFGIARPITSATPSAGLTRVGEVVGTPEYMSPEQATGDEVDGRSDLYSLGLTAWFALTGVPAMTGDTTGKILARQITEELPSIRAARPDLPPALAAAIDRCVAKDPAARFSSAEGLVEALDEAQLAPREVPLPIRLYAQELGNFSLLTIGAMVVSLMLFRGASAQRLSNIDTLLPLVVILMVIVTRGMQTVAETRRLASAGFTPDEIQRGIIAVVDERESRRAELRQDPRSRAGRRRSLTWGAILLATAVAMVRIALEARTQIGPRSYSVEPIGAVLVFGGMALLGVSLVLLLRSPFRMSVGERLFRAVWGGPLGRGFVRAAAYGAGGGRRGTTESPGPRATSASLQRPDERVTALERRVASLERWRAERQ